MKQLLLLTLILGGMGCMRQETQRVRVEVPEAESLAELEQIRAHFREEEEFLPDRIRFYEAIRISMDPEPHVEIEFVRRFLGKQNVLYRLHQLGYSVEGRSGDPALRLAFLAESELP